MKVSLYDLTAGSFVGILLFFGGFFLMAVAYGDGGLVGFDFVIRKFPIFENLFLLGIPYVVLGIFPFAFYVTTPMYKKSHQRRDRKVFLISFLVFATGIYLSYFVFLLSAAFAFSLTTGPF